MTKQKEKIDFSGIIVRYIRDNRIPVGVVVGVDGKIGWSQLNPIDIWDRKRAIHIAKQRAILSDKRSAIVDRPVTDRPITVIINRGEFKEEIKTTFSKELQRNSEIITRRMSKKETSAELNESKE